MTKRFFVLSVLLALFALPTFAQFNWPFPGGGQRGNYGVSRFAWSGEVDGTTYVRIQRNRAYAENVNGLPVQRQRYDFSDPLPRASVNLDLNVLNGRGRVRIVETPRQYNDYTAVVRIDDNDGGSDNYRFELRWPTYNDRTRDDDYRDPVGRGGAVWSGAVDGEVIVRFRGNNAWVENLSGQGSWNERYRFNAPLQSGVQFVNLNNVRGRGEIVVIEQPSRRNNFTACVLIRDRQSGASFYSFNLNWERSRYRGSDDNDYDDDRDRNDRGRDRDRDDRGRERERR
jgi:hypothetical protein